MTIVLVTVLYCATYILLGHILLLFLFVIPSAFILYTWGSLLLFLILLVILTALKITLEFKHESADWLRLHCFYYYLELAISSMFIVTGAVLFSGNIDFPMKLLIINWYLVFAIGVFPYIHIIKNVFGMQFKAIEKGSLYGASAFSKLARVKFGKKEKKGLRYLIASLIMLRDYLSYGRKEIKYLKRTISIVHTIGLYGKEIPYDQLFSLAEDLSKLPILEEISDRLNDFLELEKIKWAHNFADMPEKKKRERIGSVIEKYIIPASVILVTFLAILPENFKTEIMDFFKQVDWMDALILLGAFTLFLLLYEFWCLVSRIIELRYRDIKLVNPQRVRKEVLA